MKIAGKHGLGMTAIGAVQWFKAEGLAKEISPAITRTFSKKVTGSNPLEVPGLQSIQLQMNQ